VLLDVPSSPAPLLAVQSRGKFTSLQISEQETLRSLLLDLEKRHNQQAPQATLDTQFLPQQYRMYQFLQQSTTQERAIVDAENTDGETPLLLSLALSSFEIAKLLVEYGASVC